MLLFVNKMQEVKTAGLTVVLKIAHWVVIFNTGGAEQWIALILAEAFPRISRILAERTSLLAISGFKAKTREHSKEF